MCWNVWSILNEFKLSNFLQVIEDHDIHIACICETWFDSLTGKHTSEIKRAGFDIIHAHRATKAGGGTAVMYRNTLNVKKGEASSSKYSSFEYSFIYLYSGRLKIMLICLYRNQKISMNLFCDELVTFLENVFEKSDILIIVGDFNVWVDVEDNLDAKKLLKEMGAYGFTQIIEEPTHRCGHTLDHVYVNLYQMNLNAYVINDGFGVSPDHYPVMLEIPINESKVENTTISYRKIKDINLEKFQNEIQAIYSNINYNNNFASVYGSFQESTHKLLDLHAPIVTRRTRKHCNVPWVDAEFKNCRAKRRRLERIWRRTKNTESRDNYMTQRKLCAELSISKQRLFYSKEIEQSSGNNKSLFKIVKEILDRKSERQLPTHTDPLHLANKFNDYYIDKIKNIRKTIPQECTADYPFETFHGQVMSTFLPTTEEELKNIITKFGIKTSVEDPIPANVLKSIIDVSLPVLTKLVNKSFLEGSIDGVKQSVIDPLLKKSDLDPDNLKNYRPVNNLVFFSKLIERVVLKRLDDHMLANRLQNDNQFGYKKYHSTETMLLGIMNEVLLGFDEDKGTIILFLDLSAAFDTIDIDKLLSILNEELGIRGVALQWFRSFLKGRTQRVKIKDEYSRSRAVEYGVPQGSVLGPKLFNVNTRSQPKVFKKCCFKSSAFADDSNGRKTFSLTFQYDILKNNVADCMKEIVNWMNAHFLKINPDKTELMLFYPKKVEDDVIIKGTLFNNDQQCIRFSDVVKNVGVYLDKNANLNCHVNHIVSHTYKLLKDIGRIRNMLSKKHTEMLVHAVITSRLDYCNSLFFNMNTTNLYKLQKVQNAAARLISQKRRRNSAKNILKELHWLNVESRIIFKILLLMFKCVRGICSNNLQVCYKLYNCRPNDYLQLETRKVNTKYGKRSFEYAAPYLWNALPINCRMEENIETYKKMIKTMLFVDVEGFKQKAFKYDC